MFSILLLIDTKLNLLYCVNNIFIIDESFHLNYIFFNIKNFNLFY